MIKLSLFLREKLGTVGKLSLLLGEKLLTVGKLSLFLGEKLGTVDNLSGITKYACRKHTKVCLTLA